MSRVTLCLSMLQSLPPASPPPCERARQFTPLHHPLPYLLDVHQIVTVVIVQAPSVHLKLLKQVVPHDARIVKHASHDDDGDHQVPPPGLQALEPPEASLEQRQRALDRLAPVEDLLIEACLFFTQLSVVLERYHEVRTDRKRSISNHVAVKRELGSFEALDEL
uniref:Putative secreted protein n=1 Tax=Ixodes ricinus TaxID=34613 RepID=A0A6B0UX42_IXORI